MAQAHAEMDKEKAKALETLAQLSMQEGTNVESASHATTNRVRDKVMKQVCLGSYGRDVMP